MNDPLRPRFALTPIATALTATCMASLLAAPALSQDEQAAVLEEVMVTARKIEENLQRTPIAVSSFSGTKIDNLIMRDIREMEGFVPNFVIDSVSVAPAGASIYIRGIGTQEVEKSFDPAVGFVVDGVPVSVVNGSMANTFDYSFMEVLRGPQGTLFGKNTTGGVINIQRSRPTGELGLKYEVVAGTDDRVDINGVLNFPIIKEKLAGKIGYANYQDGGKLENVLTGDDVGDVDIEDFTATLLATPTDDFTARFTYQNFQDNTDGIPLGNRSSTGNEVNPPEVGCVVLGFCAGDTDIDEMEQDFYNEIDFELDAYTLQADWTIGPGTVTGIYGYRETEENVPTDFDGTPVSILHVVRDQDQEQTTFEIRYATNSDLSERFDFVAGYFYLDDEYQMRQDTDVTAVFGPPAAQFVATTADHERDSWAVFGEVHYNFTDKLRGTVGYRYTEEEKDYTGLLIVKLPGGIEISPLPPETGDEDWDEDTWKLGLDYQINDDVMVYGSFAQGFRSGGFNARNTQPGTSGPYDPEFVDQYEIGMKGDFLDKTLRFNTAAFFTDYDDKQEDIIFPATVGGSLTLVENAGEVEIWGVEGELTWVASENLYFNANVGYLDAEYKEFTGTDGVDRSDLELRRVPEWTGGANANYARAMGPGTLSLFLGWRYTDEYWVDATNDPRGLLDDQSIVDANIAYEWEWSEGRTVRVTVFGRDITDNQDWNSAVQIPGLISFGAVAGGEEYGLRVSGNF